MVWAGGLAVCSARGAAGVRRGGCFTVDSGTKATEKAIFRTCRKYVMNLPDHETGKVARILRKLVTVLRE